MPCNGASVRRFILRTTAGPELLQQLVLPAEQGMPELLGKAQLAGRLASAPGSC